VTTDRDRALLRLGLIDTDTQIDIDLDIIGEGTVNEVETLVLGSLPNSVRNRPASWLAGFSRICADLIGDIDAGQDPHPRCTAEEFVLSVAIARLEDLTTSNSAVANAAVAEVPESDDDFLWDAVQQDLFQDSDLGLLYDPALDGLESDPRMAEEGIQMLHPDRWFTWFGNVAPRSDPGSTG
jgi:hypothetical protein